MFSKPARNPAYEEELHLLLNSLRSETFRFILVSHNHPSIYLDIKAALREHFGGNRKIHEFSFAGKTPSEIRDAVVRLDRGILLLRDVEYLLRDEHDELCTYFNQRRDFFAKHDIAFLFFIEPGSFGAIPRKIPDWWSLRSLELEFTVPTEKDSEMTAVWIAEEPSPYANWTAEERELELARLERLIAATDPENKQLLAWLHADLGEVWYSAQRTEKALENYEQSLNLFKSIGDRKGEGMMLNDISQVHDFNEDYYTALRYLEQSLAIQQKIGDRQGEGRTLNNIGRIYNERGDYATALRYLEKSLDIQQEIGDLNGEGRSLSALSVTAYAQGDFDTALRYLEKSLAIRLEIGDRKGEGIILSNIGRIHEVKGDYDTALRYLETSLAIQQEIGDWKGEGINLNIIGQIYNFKGDFDTALRHLEKSLAIRQEIGDKSGIATSMYNMGTIYLDHKNDLETATALLFNSYTLLTQMGSPNSRQPAAYLQKIIERIGEDSYREILSKHGLDDGGLDITGR